jgi:hypothetical protein
VGAGGFEGQVQLRAHFVLPRQTFVPHLEQLGRVHGFAVPDRPVLDA